MSTVHRRRGAPAGTARRVLTLGGLFLCAGMLSVPSAQAQEATAETEPSLPQKVGLTGSVRAGYWSSTRSLDRENHLGAGMIWLKSTRQVSSRVSFLVEGWTALRGRSGDGDARGEIREAFVEVRVGRLDVRAGRQIIAWGRADGLNPTDNLTGEDLTLLAPDDDDRRLGTTAVRASYYLGDVAVTGVWLPEFRGHRFPLPPAPGFMFVRERSEWPRDQWAIRVEQTGRAVDWSVSGFRGRDLTPDVSVRLGAVMPEGEAAIVLSHRRVQVFGADMVANLGRIGLRAEGAYVDTEDGAGRDPFTKNPFLFVVVGGDRTFREYLNLNVQYLHRFVRGHRTVDAGLSPSEAGVAELQDVLNSQTARMQHGASFRVSYKWLRETLEGECAAAGFFGPDGLAFRPKVTYTVTDHWKVLVGAEIYRGESSSVFGLLRPNSTAYLETRWSF
jgi:hypothetical protein